MNAQGAIRGALPRWWVNQGASYKAERDEQFIWAPKVTKSGSPVSHHTAVRDVRVGDVIIHYSDKNVRAIGTAVSDGYSAAKPESLTGDQWEADGWRADVEYRELETPIALSSIAEATRLTGEGPFTSVGGVRQGYLFALPDSMRSLLSGSPLHRIGGVYVGNDGAVNLKVGLGAGTWGWTTRYDEPAELAVGDLFLIAYGGGGRLKVDAWMEKTAKEIHVCRVTRTLFEDRTPLWPDETDEHQYPYRIGLEILSSVRDFDYNRLPLEVNKLFQTSATKQGRAFVGTFDSTDQILLSLGASDMPEKAADPEGSIEDVVELFASALKKAHVDYGDRHDDLVRRFVSSLATKRFLILTGLSGSGKTKLAQAFGEWLGKERYEIVPVRPDWTSPDYLLGYRNELAAPTANGSQPWVTPETLDLVLRAAADPSRPYLLILDEMNLAHVERYFADVLSGIESNERVIPNVIDGAQDENEKLVRLPDNLFVVGTVNVDETTYMFSPKVLDRANTIEFRVKTSDLGNTPQRPDPLETSSSGVVTRFLADSTAVLETDRNSSYAEWVRNAHALLSRSGREFGHRSYAEMMEFRTHFLAAGGDESRAFDVQICQKVLPRIHGSQRDVGPTLKDLAAFCFNGPDVAVDDAFKIEDVDAKNAVLDLSYDKIVRMWRRLQDTHFVSFAE